MKSDARPSLHEAAYEVARRVRVLEERLFLAERDRDHWQKNHAALQEAHDKLRQEKGADARQVLLGFIQSCIAPPEVKDRLFKSKDHAAAHTLACEYRNSLPRDPRESDAVQPCPRRKPVELKSPKGTWQVSHVGGSQPWRVTEQSGHVTDFEQLADLLCMVGAFPTPDEYARLVDLSKQER